MLAVLARAEAAIDGIKTGAVELGVGDEVGELGEGDLDALADTGAKATAQRPVIGGDTLTDRRDHLIAERRDVRADQRSERGLEQPPGLIDRVILCVDDKNSTARAWLEVKKLALR